MEFQEFQKFRLWKIMEFWKKKVERRYYNLKLLRNKATGSFSSLINLLQLILFACRIELILYIMKNQVSKQSDKVLSFKSKIGDIWNEHLVCPNVPIVHGCWELLLFQASMCNVNVISFFILWKLG